MKKSILCTAFLLVGLFYSTPALFAQVSADLEPYFDTYTRFVTTNQHDSVVLMHQYDRIVKDTTNLKNRLSSSFSGRSFSNFEFLKVGGYGTHTPVRGNVSSESSDLDIDMLFKINNGIKADISAFTFKTEVQNWLTSIFSNTDKSWYTFTMKDPVIEIKADTILPDGTTFSYHMDLGSFNRLNNPQNPNCHPAKFCSELAWGIKSDNDINHATWQETEAPSFTGDFNLKFPEGNAQGDKVLSDCKMLKYWNKLVNKDAIPENVPPSLTYLIGAYNWVPQWSPTTGIYRLQQLTTVVDSLRKNIFNNNCSSVAGAHLYVPFYTSLDSNVLSKMDTNALKKFCDSLKKLSDTLHFVSGQSNLERSLLALSNVFPDFNNVPAGTYHINSYNSSKVIYPMNGGEIDGDSIVQYTSSNDASKKWRIANIEASQGKFYYVLTNLKSGKVLDVSNASNAQGAPIIQWSNNNGNNQKWEIVFLAYYNNKRLYKIVSKNSNLLLDVTGASINNDAKIIQWPDNGQNNQKWYFEEVPATWQTR